MQTELIFSQEDFLVNHTQVQEKDLEKKMTDTSGRRCLERFGKFNHVGLWAKTFSDLLIGQTGWFSTKCKLTWKLKGTKYNRMYFQLYPSTHHTEGIESGLLPTPTCMDSTNATATMKSTQVKEGSMHSVTLTRAMAMGLLPTPCVGTHGRGGIPHKGVVNALLNGEKPKIQELLVDRVFADELKKKGVNHVETFRNFQMPKEGLLPTPCATEAEKPGKGDSQNSLTRMVLSGEMLPTPRTSDERMHWKTENWKGDDLGSHINEMLGTRSHLSPQFVLEMMGFPTDWTLLPFLNGETSQSKQEEMP
jgi:hypothetical protein